MMIVVWRNFNMSVMCQIVVWRANGFLNKQIILHYKTKSYWYLVLNTIVCEYKKKIIYFQIVNVQFFVSKTNVILNIALLVYIFCIVFILCTKWAWL